MSVFTVYTALLIPLVSCTDSITDADDASTRFNATKPASMETFSNDEKITSIYADASDSTTVATDGFVGEVLDDTVRVSWNKDPDATGYNVYRQGKYYTTVFETEFHDADIQVQDYSYKITAFEKSGEDTRFYTIANGLTVSVPPKPVNDTYFKSSMTDGFVGEVVDDTIRISWKKDPDATGYNVYRQGEYYTTVFETEFHDADIQVQDYSYKITAFDKSGEDTRFYTIANGLTVSVPPKPVNDNYFKSSITDGFVGEVLDDTVRVSWNKDPDATGYNVYRQGKYYTTVFETEFHDVDIQVQDYSYKITAFEKSGEDTRFYTIANGLTVSVPPKPVNDNYFESSITDGFVGEVLDDTVRVSWNKDPDATGYNVYRQGEYYTTVFETEFHDADIQVQDYSYKITAFEKSGENTRFYTIATGLIVSIRPQGKTEFDISKVDADLLYTGESGSIEDSDSSTNGTVKVKTTTPESITTTSDSADTASIDSESTETQANGTGHTNIDSTELSTPDTYTTPVEEPDTTSPEQANAKRFESITTEGFVGEVLDDSIRISWNLDPEASGYNIYKQAEYYTTVFTNEFHDTDVYDQNYYYEIQAFEHRENESDTRYYYIATGLTVSARTLGKTDPDGQIRNDNLLNDYELVFADEFNGNSLDASKWNTSFLWGTDLIINSEEQYYVDILKNPEFGFNPFTFDGSNLTINTIKTPPELATKSLDQPYLSGIITSYDAFKFTYGYAEVRAKMTHGRGYWPAFWLLNAYYGGDDPEIDIMEFIGDNQDVVYHTFHYYDDSGKLRSSNSEPTPGIDYTSDFHTFSVEWKPGSIIYYVDGIEAHRITDPKVPQEQMYLIANTAVGGWWAGSPDKSTPFPGSYVIDYIRVYQKATIYNDMLYDDGMTEVPYADNISNQALPNHRPTRDQWPEGYRFR